jgi:WD40 repeat protein
VRTLKGHESRVGSLCWNGTGLTSGSHDKSIINWDLRQSNPIVSKFESHYKEVCGLAWSPDQRYLASGGNDNALMLWEQRMVSANQREPFMTKNEHVAAVKVIQIFQILWILMLGFSLVPLALEYLGQRGRPQRLQHENLGVWVLSSMN